MRLSLLLLTLTLTLPASVVQQKPLVINQTSGRAEQLQSGNGLQAGTLSTGSTEVRLLSVRAADVVNVKDFGAVGDGITDDTVAIVAAFQHARDIQQEISATESGAQAYLISSTAPTVFFPSGKYKISSYVGGLMNNVKIVGSGSLLVSTDRSMDLVKLGTYNISISGMIFDGGARHLRFGGERIESGQVYIQDCQFRNAKIRCVVMDRVDIVQAGYPANIRIHNCKSYGSGFLEAYCNGITIADSWLAWDTSATSWDGGPLLIANDNLRLYNICEVPFNVNSAHYPRVQDATGYAGEDFLAVTAYGCRFGGETTQTPIFSFQSTGSSLLMDGCSIFGVANCYWGRCAAMPEHLTVRACSGGTSTGFINTWGLWFNSGLTLSTIPPVCRLQLELSTTTPNAYRTVSSADFTVNGGARFNLIPAQGHESSGTVTNQTVGDGITWWASPYTLDASLAAFSGGTTLMGVGSCGTVAFSGEGYLGIQLPGFNPGAGTYTFSAYVRATSRTTWYFFADAGGVVTATGTLEVGNNRVVVTFTQPAAARTLKFGLTGTAGDNPAVGLFAVHAGSLAVPWTAP